MELRLVVSVFIYQDTKFEAKQFQMSGSSMCEVCLFCDTRSYVSEILHPSTISPSNE